MLQSAADSLFRCIVLKGDFINVLDATFANRGTGDTVSVLYTAVQSLGLCPPPPPQSEDDRPSSFASGSDIPPFPPPGTPLREVKCYVKRLAHLYVNDLRIYTSLVADLIGSPACNARYMLIERSPLMTQLLLTGVQADRSDRSSDTSGPIYSFTTAESTFS